MPYTQSDLKRMYEAPSKDLTDRVRTAIASLPSHEQEEKIVKKKLSFSVISIIAALLTLMAVSYGATTLWRVVTWNGEVSRNVEPNWMDESAAEDESLREAEERLRRFMLDVRDEETVFAWVEDGQGEKRISDLHKKKKTFDTVDAFTAYMSNVLDLTPPAWIPDGEYKYFSAEVYMDLKPSGGYDVIGEGGAGPVRYSRFLIHEDSALVTGYQMTFSLDDGSVYHIWSGLWAGTDTDEALALREGETVRQVTVPEMTDAILISAQDPSWPDGLLMRRTLKEPVAWERLTPDGRAEDGPGRYDEEWVQAWVFNHEDPEILLKLFSGE